MFVYRDEKGHITDVTGSINHAELERLKQEYGEVELGKAKGESSTDFSSVDQDSLDALNAAKAPDPVPEPRDDESFRSALDAPEESEEVASPARNASRDEWADFLDEKKVKYDDDAGRDDLIALWDESPKSKKG